MKYTLNGYSQKECLKLGLDVVDIFILRWISDFYPSMTKKIFDGKEFGWVSYRYLLADMPLLGIQTVNGLSRRLVKLEEVGLIERHCQKNKDGTFSYIRITQQIQVLLSSTTGSAENDDGGSAENDDHNNTSTKYYPSTKELKNNSENNNTGTKINTLEKLKSWDFTTDKEFIEWSEKKSRETWEKLSGRHENCKKYVLFKIDELINWCESTGKRKKDYKATLKNWINKDIVK